MAPLIYIANQVIASYMLDWFGYFNFSNSVTVGDCMGDPPENWYRPAPYGAPDPKLLVSY
jgi:hypothetical protein